MEGGSQSHASTTDDRPLLPVHNVPLGPGPYQVVNPVRRDTSPLPPLPASPTSPQDTRPPASAGSDMQQHEADIVEPQRPMSARVDNRGNSRRRARDTGLDWIVPTVHNGVEKEIVVQNTVEDRLKGTLTIAKEEQLKYEKRANQAGLLINIAMFAQVCTNAIITGLSASTSNRNAQIGVAAMGAINTVISTVLVRARGTNEPQRSKTHSENLERFIRQLEAFILDEGHSHDRKWDGEVNRFRTEFDRLQTAVHQSENGQPMSSTTANEQSSQSPASSSVKTFSTLAPPVGPTLPKDKV